MTLFSLWRHLCGLSQREVAAVLGMSLRSVEDFEAWKPCKPAIIAEMRELRERIEAAADEMLTGLEGAIREAREAAPGAPVDGLDVGYAADDHEARAMGWPCMGAQRASLALVIEALPPEIEVRLVPRGSRPASAAAADAHGR